MKTLPDWSAIATSNDALTAAEAKAERFLDAIEGATPALLQLKADIIKLLREAEDEE